KKFSVALNVDICRSFYNLNKVIKIDVSSSGFIFLQRFHLSLGVHSFATFCCAILKRKFA
ncbi:12196_t:CDS:2, partial [Dentiscutata heterogama]